MEQARCLRWAFVAAAMGAVVSGCLGSSGTASPHGDTSRACKEMPNSGPVAAPDVVGASFDRAVARLLNHHLRISVRRFAPFHNAMAEQGWGRLENYRVVSQSVAPGAQVAAGAVVALKLDTPEFRGPLGSMGEPIDHPTYVSIPNLVGDGYPKAMSVGNAFTTGIFVRVGETGPLSPGASVCGLNAFVVSAQTPRPGQRVLWGGVKSDGVDPRLATVTITLESRPPGTP